MRSTALYSRKQEPRDVITLRLTYGENEILTRLAGEEDRTKSSFVGRLLEAEDMRRKSEVERAREILLKAAEPVFVYRHPMLPAKAKAGPNLEALLVEWEDARDRQTMGFPPPITARMMKELLSKPDASFAGRVPEEWNPLPAFKEAAHAYAEARRRGGTGGAPSLGHAGAPAAPAVRPPGPSPYSSPPVAYSPPTAAHQPTQGHPGLPGSAAPTPPDGVPLPRIPNVAQVALERTRAAEARLYAPPPEPAVEDDATEAGRVHRV